MLLRTFAAPPPPTAAAAPPSSPLILPLKTLRFNIFQNKSKPFSPIPITLRKTQNTSCTASSTSTTETNEYEYGPFEEEYELHDWVDGDDGSCPWEGAIMYKRNAAITNLEYCTTLERLGLGKISTEVAKSTAKAMGMRVLKSVKDYPDGTPVLVSVEVVRKKGKLRLDGIVRTVIGLPCYMCYEASSQSVYSEFSLLLCEEPIEEPESILDAAFGDDKSNNSEMGGDDDDDSSIDFDDRLYFPVGEKTVDISKNIRDLIHIEIAYTAVCDPNCRGLCMQCGANLNKSKCTCSSESDVEEKGLGPLGNLREKMQQT